MLPLKRNRLVATICRRKFAGQNLTMRSSGRPPSTDADFTGAEVRGANFYTRKHPAVNYPFDSGTGITPAQLDSTASYRDHDLSGIGFHGNELTKANLTEQNLTATTSVRLR